MNRSIIITTGIIILLLVLGVWIYLMFFGAPENKEEVFTNFGFRIQPQEVTIIPDTNTGNVSPLVDTQTDALRQLTTRPVAGFAFASTSEGEAVRYVERGTGHIYEINLATGVESALSRTTIPQVNEAVFSHDAEVVALISHERYQSEVFVGTLGNNINLTGISLQPNASNISFTLENEVQYTIAANGTTKGYRHNIDTLVQTELFSMNYTNLDVGWGNGLEKIFLATKPAQGFEGFMYTIENNILTPVAFSAQGLSALFTNTYILTSFIQGDTYSSAVVTTATQERLELPILALKEKCVPDTTDEFLIWCAASLNNQPATFGEDWYKGTVISEDSIWLIDPLAQTADVYANLGSLSGRTIDVKEIDMNTKGTLLSFVNKADQTLWLYDIFADIKF
ncbi:MAG: hypothetical protein ACI92I_000284 [Acidimicrobiales bacterium]|jgi:hypothetical protein